jgi:hypothetical protein
MNKKAYMSNAANVSCADLTVYNGSVNYAPSAEKRTSPPFSMNTFVVKAFRLCILTIAALALTGCNHDGDFNSQGTTSQSGVTAQLPTITVHPIGAIYTQNETADELTVKASVTDDGTLSYQWFRIDQDSAADGTEIEGATDAAYMPATDISGTVYYYAVVTNNVSAQTVSAISQTAEIVVKLPEHTVQCYDADLNKIAAVTVEEGDNALANICGSGSWYQAGAKSSSKNLNIKYDINFYAVSDVKEIRTLSELKSVGVNGKYILMNDIAAGSWTPIGSGSSKFVGIFSGNSHTISFSINKSNSNYLGLFAAIGKNGAVKNLNLEIGTVIGSWEIGSVAGLVDGGNIINCHVTGGEINGDEEVGGIAGWVKNNGAIIDSSFEGRVIGYKGSIGGIAGNVEGGEIINAKVIASVEGCYSGCGARYSNYVGGIAGYMEGTIKNSVSTGDVKGYQYVGGISGKNMKGSITNVYSEGNIYAANAFAGGIAGYIQDGNILNAYSLGNVEMGGSKENAGGIAGYISGSIKNAFSLGNVSGAKYIGGIAGQTSGSITYTYALGNIKGSEYVGGIVGESTTYNIKQNAAINPAIIGGSKYINRIGGYLPSPDATGNLAWEYTEIAEKDKNYIGDPVSIHTLRDKTAYEAMGWSFGNDDAHPWVMENTDMYPRFYWQTNGVTKVLNELPALVLPTDSCETLASGEYCVRFYDAGLNLVERRQLSGGMINPADLEDGSWYLADANVPSAAVMINSDVNLYAIGGVKEVKTQADLEAVNANSLARSGKYMLTNNITLSLVGSGWEPVGNYNARFTGIFNGNGHTISGLWIDKAEATGMRYAYIGLFGAIGENGAVKNLKVIADDSKGGIRGYEYVGAIAGAIFYGSIDNCHSDGKIAAAYQNAGGIAGYMDNRAVIKASGSSGFVFVEKFNGGGVVGKMVSGTIENSYSTGEISGGGVSSHFGGIAGYFVDGMIVKSYSTASITGQNFLGGIAGYVQEINALISASYFNGSVKAVGRNAGGIAGYMDKSGIINCYSAGEISAIDTVGGIAGVISERYGFAAYSYSIAKVEGTGADTEGLGSFGSDVGGIVGSAYYAKVINNAAINDAVIGAKNTNRVNGLTMQGGGTANNFALTDMSVTIANGENGSAGIDKTSSELKLQSTYSVPVEDGGLGWRFGSTVVAPWVMPESGYPYLYWEKQ